MSREKALDPNNTPAMLASLVDDYPQEILDNPVTLLLDLEDPALNLVARADSALMLRELKSNQVVLGGEFNGNGDGYGDGDNRYNFKFKTGGKV
jgi:hypothetical protein